MSMASTRRNQSFHGVSVAVIDDDDAFLELVTILLAERGYRSVPCRDSAEAFAMLEREQVDLIVLDLVMETAESGWDILRFVRLHPIIHGTPVVVCSADIRGLRENECLLREWDAAVLHKPFNILDFYTLIDELLDQNGSEQSMGTSAGMGS